MFTYKSIFRLFLFFLVNYGRNWYVKSAPGRAGIFLLFLIPQFAQDKSSNVRGHPEAKDYDDVAGRILSSGFHESILLVPSSRY
jgi:hypothetical protein